MLPIVSAAEEVCGCNRLVPYPGDYRIDFPEKRGTPGVGGAKVQVGIDAMGSTGGTIIAKGAKGILSLSCVPGGGFAGVLQPHSQKASIAPGALGALAGGYTGVNGTVPMGLDMTDKFDVIVVRPGLPAASNEVLEPFLKFSRRGGRGKMPEEFCTRVSNAIASAETMKAAYSDPAIVQQALDESMAGLVEQVQAWPDNGFVGSYRPQNPDLTYDEFIGLSIDGGAKLLDGDIVRETSEVGASLNTEDCTINPPKSHRKSGACWLSIEIEAMMAHEADHRRLCLEKRAAAHNDKAFLYWTNHPPNQSASVVSAYDATLDILRPWYATHCGG